MSPKFQIIIIALFSFLLLGCPSDDIDGSKSLCIKNLSGQTIYYWFSYDLENYHYPNTILPINIPTIIRGAGSGGCVGNDIGQTPKWENVFTQLPEGKFSVYFFDELAITQEEWEDVRINHVVLRKDVTFDELKNNDYIIHYPL